MNISEFEKPANEKLAKINEALDTLYGFRVYDTIDIKKLYDVKKDLKTKLKELEATLPFNSHNSDPKYMKHVLLAEAIDNMIEAKKKDHDKDGDIDSDDYMAARDKAIKKAMGKEVDEVSSMGMNKYGLAAKHMNGKFYSYKDGVETGVFDSMEELKAHQEKILQQMDTKHNQESIQDDELSKQLARLKELSGI